MVINQQPTTSINARYTYENVNIIYDKILKKKFSDIFRKKKNNAQYIIENFLNH